MKRLRNLSDAYKKNIVTTYKQLDIDIALSLLKLSRKQIANILERIDRKWDCAKDLNFTDIVTQQDKYFLRFEHPAHLESSYFSLNELSIEDKIYLLETIEKK